MYRNPDTIVVKTKEQFMSMTVRDRNEVIRQLSRWDRQNTIVTQANGLWKIITQVDAIEVNGILRLLGSVHSWDADEVEAYRGHKFVNISIDELNQLIEYFKDAEYPDVLLKRFRA